MFDEFHDLVNTRHVFTYNITVATQAASWQRNLQTLYDSIYNPHYEANSWLSALSSLPNLWLYLVVSHTPVEKEVCP